MKRPSRSALQRQEATSVHLAFLSMDHREGLFALYSDAETAALDDWEPISTRSQAEDMVRRAIKRADSGDGLDFAILDDKGAFAGCCGAFDFDMESENCCVYVQVLKDKRGQGIGTQAIAQLSEVLFYGLGAHRVYAYVTPGNEASLRILEKNGYQREGLLRDMEFYKGRFWDGIVMARLSGDAETGAKRR
jgi:[ribosomal protein S5]-alanine N-acetyltransferase